MIYALNKPTWNSFLNAETLAGLLQSSFWSFWRNSVVLKTVGGALNISWRVRNIVLYCSLLRIYNLSMFKSSTWYHILAPKLNMNAWKSYFNTYGLPRLYLLFVAICINANWYKIPQIYTELEEHLILLIFLLVHYTYLLLEVWCKAEYI